MDARDIPLGYGRLGNFKTVYFPTDRDLTGQFVNVKITDIKNSSLFGELI
jgi:tRNA A37 methylthiotransferase MiaB